jgi:predicted Zn-dependent peptidase
MRAALFREIRRFLREGVDTEDFGRIIHKMMGRFVRSLDSQESTAFHLLSSVFKGMDPFRVPSLIRTLTPDDVVARHEELFGRRNHTTSIVRPV